MSIFSSKSSDFLDSIHDEISDLQNEIAKLARKGGLPIGKPSLSEKASEQWHNSRDYVRDRAEEVARSAREHPTGISVGSLLVLGAVGFGIYALTKQQGKPEYAKAPEAPIDPQI